MSSDYAAVKALHASLPPFAPFVPTSWLPTLAFLLLFSAFSLTFYFSTLPKSNVPVKEIGVAATASVLAGFGVVALFCSAGVYL